MRRRELLFAGAGALAAKGKQPTVLLRSGWQSVNIGDIAHTPGVLAVIEKHWPNSRVILWPGEIERGTAPMLSKRFPKLEVVRGAVDASGGPSTPELKAAFAEADVFFHGSGPSVTSPAQVECWAKTTGKPYGFFGITVSLTGENASSKLDARTERLLRGAKFVFTRETKSLANLKSVGMVGPEIAFAPDGTFQFDIRDEEKGTAFLRENGLEEGKFLAIVPRLRITPYHRFRKPIGYGPEEVERRDKVNAEHAERDHAKLRELAIAWVEKTGGKVLFCPEMTYELDIIGPLLYDPLPANIKAKAVARKTYWLPDEAASVYARAAAVVSMECHSPIIAAAVGTPCAYVHQPEDGIKGQMWPDVGLADCYFQVEETSGTQLSQRVLRMWSDSKAAKRHVAGAVKLARKRQNEAMEKIKKIVGI